MLLLLFYQFGYTHTHIGQRSKLGVDWSRFHLILTQDLWLILDSTDLARLAGQEAPGMLLTPPPQCRHYRYVLPHVLWMWVLEIQILVFILVWQSVYWLSLLPSPSYLFKSFHGMSQKQSPPSSLNSNAIYDNHISTTCFIRQFKSTFVPFKILVIFLSLWQWNCSNGWDLLTESISSDWESVGFLFHIFICRESSKVTPLLSKPFSCLSAYTNPSLSIFHQPDEPCCNVVFMNSVYLLIKHKHVNWVMFYLWKVGFMPKEI